MHRRSFMKHLPAVPALLSAATAASAAALHISQLGSSTASLAGFSFEGALEKLRDLGFDGVEISTYTGASHSAGLFPGAIVADLPDKDKPRLQAAVRKFRLVSTHLPHRGMRMFAADPAIRKASVDLVHRAIDDSGFWGASVGTLHAAQEPGVAEEKLWADMLAVFRELGDHAAKYNLRLGIETGYPNTVAGYLRLIREIDHRYVGATVDTGHIKSYRQDIGIADSERETTRGARRYNDVLLEIVQELGAKLFHFHVDDVRPADWRDHRKLGTGLVDWVRLLQRVSKIGYQGAFAIELEESPPVQALVESRAFFADVLRKVATPG